MPCVAKPTEISEKGRSRSGWLWPSITIVDLGYPSSLESYNCQETMTEITQLPTNEINQCKD